MLHRGDKGGGGGALGIGFCTGEEILILISRKRDDEISMEERSGMKAWAEPIIHRRNKTR